MKKYKFEFYADKDNINELRVGANIKNNHLKGIEVNVDNTDPVFVEELANCYKIIWYDEYENIMDGNDIGKRVYKFWRNYISENNLR